MLMKMLNFQHKFMFFKRIELNYSCLEIWDNMHLGQLVIFYEIFLLLFTPTCQKSLAKFICEDGNVISFSKTCNGIKDCPDGSDEMKKLCYHIICPPNRFRCHYGACIQNSTRCDGINQCADGSDENQCGERLGSCDINEFKCTSGECISSIKTCNSIEDCKDGSDERPNTCEDIICPLNSYKCNVGGCIHLNQRCNGYKDCIDGSDESKILCNNLNCTDNADCQKEETYCPPITSQRIIVRCIVPYGKKKGLVPCYKPLPKNTIVTYECKPYYTPASSRHVNNRKMICQADGTWNREALKCKPECGVMESEVIPLINYGWTVKPNSFPWHITLYALEEGKWLFICGGTLISEQAVITAAHCTWSIDKDLLQVALGKYYSDFSIKEQYVQIRNISEIIRHPLYQDYIGNYGSDIAVLVLKESVEFSAFLKPICIDWNLDDITSHLSTNNLGMIVGMGVTENNTFSKKLKATFLPVTSDEECIKQQQPDFKKYITFTSFCAGWTNGTGVCNGDSGGGLVFPITKDSNRWTLQGIVSVSPRRRGTSFCDPNYYTVFTKVGMYVEWLYKVLMNIHVDMHDPFVENDIVVF